METNVVTDKMSGIMDGVVQHRNKVLVFLAALVAGGAAYFGYAYYQRGVQVAAHQAFVVAMKLHETPVKKDAKMKGGFANEQEKWTKVEEAFRTGYEKNKSSSLAPMFLAFQAMALVNLQKLPEAINTLKAAIYAMKSGPVKSYYEATLSLMQLDSENKADQEAGLNHLRTVAYDTKNVAQGLALYHLGLRAWVQKDFNEAKNFWQQFMVKFGETAGFEYQTSIVKDRLELLVG